ncbi:protein prenyltransferase alpha subunit repeat-containing protein 1-like [Lineus longissimus]|uniref:protein prenyltransferase alpha subunit repeat-containing protein 1-like n=1 Tax=Lineus longissimus TaxID=88925 RepID=UPI002B4C6917
MAEDSRGSRIFSDFNSAFNRDPDIDEFDIIPILEPKQNRSPVVLIDHKLGLEHWCVRILYSYAYDRLMDWRTKHLGARSLDYGHVIELTRAVLAVNPDVATAWNIRKETVQKGHLRVAQDFKFGALLLRKHPKSPETFCHRKWLFNHLMRTDPRFAPLNFDLDPLNIDAINVQLAPSGNVGEMRLQIPSDVLNLVQEEMSVCQMAADRYPSNYNAWSHRIWVLQHVGKCDRQILLTELDQTKEWVSLNISDHSGFHYRQFVVRHLYPDHESDEVDKTILEVELDDTTDLLKRYPEHESVWCHRRFIVEYLQSTSNHETRDGSPDREVTKKSRLDVEDDTNLDIIQRELEFCKKFINNSKKKSVKQQLALKYRTWLERTFMECVDDL